MGGGKGKHFGLCPISFGLALGITCGIVVLFWAIGEMYYGISPMMQAQGITQLTWGSSIILAIWALVKGFIFGIILALIYDFILYLGAKCRCKSMSGCKCGCSCEGCTCCKPEKKSNHPLT